MNVLSPSRDPTVSFGAAALDARVGALRRAALHEVYAGAGDAAAATAFALLVALRGEGDAPIVLVRDDRGVGEAGRVSGDGLADLGLDPARLIVVHAPGALAALRAAADGVACAGVGAVVVAPWGAAPAFDLTASRRLALRAERSGVLIVVVRVGVEPSASAAATRWHVAAAPSSPRAANAPGDPAFVIRLLRHRGGVAGFDARVEWNRDARTFDDAPLPRVSPAVPARRAGDAPPPRGAGDASPARGAGDEIERRAA